MADGRSEATSALLITRPLSRRQTPTDLRLMSRTSVVKAGPRRSGRSVSETGAMFPCRFVSPTTQLSSVGPRRPCDLREADIASPSFRRVEGVSLHGYLTQLRVAPALVELRQGDDLTTLALEPLQTSRGTTSTKAS